MNVSSSIRATPHLDGCAVGSTIVVPPSTTIVAPLT
jgi:hypothetical protein